MVGPYDSAEITTEHCGTRFFPVFPVWWTMIIRLLLLIARKKGARDFTTGERKSQLLFICRENRIDSNTSLLLVAAIFW